MEIVLLCLLCAGVLFAVVRWLFRVDEKIEDRRRAAAKLAGVLSALGLKKTPAFLIDYSVGDYSGMANKIKDLAELFLAGEEAVVVEFAQVFEGCLKAKLATETGRAFIAAKLEDAVKDRDVSAVKNAPTPTVSA